jgi:hypothetical protein
MKILAITLVLLAVPATAIAQAGSVITRADIMSRHEVLTQGLRRQAMDQNQDQYRDTQNPRRIHRAEEAARLINEGNCPAAYELAARANDRQLGARIEEACGHAVVTPAREQTAPAAH